MQLPASSVVLIGPDHRRRLALADMLAQLSVRVKAELSYYPDLAEALELTSEGCDALVVDIEGDVDVALGLIEEVGRANPTVTAMAYARREDPDLLIRCMESGARTLLQEPISRDVLTSALARASARRAPATEPARKKGKSFLFWSVKGGAGASTLAVNFAVGLAKSSGQKVALVDLHLDLGDLAVLLDMKPRFSILDAVNNATRMDADFLGGLMEEHSSGVSLLAASDSYEMRQYGDHQEFILRLIRILEGQFSFVVFDTATGVNLPEAIVREFETIYLVSQVDVPSLRHAQRLSSQLSRWTPVGKANPVQVVLNRYDPKKSLIATDEIESILKMPVAQKVPNDYASVRDAANTGVLTVLTASPVGRAVQQMADAASGKDDTAKPQKKGWRLF